MNIVVQQNQRTGLKMTRNRKENGKSNTDKVCEVKNFRVEFHIKAAIIFQL